MKDTIIPPDLDDHVPAEADDIALRRHFAILRRIEKIELRLSRLELRLVGGGFLAIIVAEAARYLIERQ